MYIKAIPLIVSLPPAISEEKMCGLARVGAEDQAIQDGIL
jgi:hypothetical protein